MSIAAARCRAHGLRSEIATSRRQLLFAMLGAMFTLAGLAWAAITLTLG